MTSSPAIRLYFLRAAGLFAQGSLLVAATILFAFGMLDLFTVLAYVALALVWIAQQPATTRIIAGIQFHEHSIGGRVSPSGRLLDAGERDGITEKKFTSLRSFRARARARKALTLPTDRFDLTFSVATTLVWLSYFGFISSVLAGA